MEVCKWKALNAQKAVGTMVKTSERVGEFSLNFDSILGQVLEKTPTNRFLQHKTKKKSYRHVFQMPKQACKCGCLQLEDTKLPMAAEVMIKKSQRVGNFLINFQAFSG